MSKRIALLALLSLSIAALMFIKPIRVLAPQLAGVSCVDNGVCVEETSRRVEASKLYSEALHFVESTVDEINQKPRVIFCSTDSCYRSFGLAKSAAGTIATLGIVVSPRGWQPHYLRHEMIHYLQHEQLGNLKMLLTTPTWFKEGMAYSLSDDPRPALAQPLQQHRSQFDAWYKKIGKERLWVEARNL